MTVIEEKRDIEKIINATLKEISSIEAIYLFGSIAKGEENEKSDYDIAVIVREYPDQVQKRCREHKTHHCGMQYSRLSCLILKKQELSDICSMR